MVSKACYVAAYRRKLELLAAEPDIDLTLVVPPYWRFGSRRAPLEPGFDRGYRTIVANPALNGWHHLHFYRAMGAILAETRPDLVHIDEEPYDIVTWHTLRAARRAGAKALFFTWQNLPLALPLPFRLLRSRVLAQAAGAIAGNQEGAQILRDLGYRGPLEVIPQFGVDPEVFPWRARETAGPVTIGYAGRLVPEKGVGDLLEALALLEGLPWRLAVAGSGPEEGRLRERAAALGLDGRVTWLGAVDSTAMPAVMAALDVLVLPSRTMPRWKEQFGRVLVEAMASGAAVVGTRSGEIPQVIGDAGVIVPEGDPGALRAALERLLDDPAERLRLGRLGRERVLASFTQARIAGRTAAFYRQVLAGEGGSPAAILT